MGRNRISTHRVLPLHRHAGGCCPQSTGVDVEAVPPSWMPGLEGQAGCALTRRAGPRDGRCRPPCAAPVAPAQHRSKLLHRHLEGLGQRRRIGRRQQQDHRGTAATPARIQVETQPRLVGVAMVEEGEFRLGEAEPPVAAAGLRLARAGNRRP